jgi:hypothetical protein
MVIDKARYFCAKLDIQYVLQVGTKFNIGPFWKIYAISRETTNMMN